MREEKYEKPDYEESKDEPISECYSFCIIICAVPMITLATTYLFISWAAESSMAC